MKPDKLIETPQIKDNTTIDFDTAYTEAESGFLSIPGAGDAATEIQTLTIDLLGGAFCEVHSSAVFHNYAEVTKIVDFYVQYSLDEGINWITLDAYHYGNNLTIEAGETLNIPFICCIATDYFFSVEITSIVFSLRAVCENDNTSIKASHRRLNITQGKGK